MTLDWFGLNVVRHSETKPASSGNLRKWVSPFSICRYTFIEPSATKMSLSTVQIRISKIHSQVFRMRGTGTSQSTRRQVFLPIQRHALIRKAQAVGGSDITRDVSGSLRSFLKEPSLPTYYKLKVYLALSGANEENEPWKNIAACRYFLREAEKALQEAQKIYVNKEYDAEVFRNYERIVQKEWEELRKREQLADSDGDSD